MYSLMMDYFPVLGERTCIYCLCYSLMMDCFWISINAYAYEVTVAPSYVVCTMLL
jgi:hypothetical protein